MAPPRTTLKGARLAYKGPERAVPSWALVEGRSLGLAVGILLCSIAFEATRRRARPLLLVLLMLLLVAVLVLVLLLVAVLVVMLLVLLVVALVRIEMMSCLWLSLRLRLKQGRGTSRLPALLAVVAVAGARVARVVTQAGLSLRLRLCLKHVEAFANMLFARRGRGAAPWEKSLCSTSSSLANAKFQA